MSRGIRAFRRPPTIDLASRPSFWRCRERPVGAKPVGTGAACGVGARIYARDLRNERPAALDLAAPRVAMASAGRGDRVARGRTRHRSRGPLALAAGARSRVCRSGRRPSPPGTRDCGCDCLVGGGRRLAASVLQWVTGGTAHRVGTAEGGCRHPRGAASRGLWGTARRRIDSADRRGGGRSRLPEGRGSRSPPSLAGGCGMGVRAPGSGPTRSAPASRRT